MFNALSPTGITFATPQDISCDEGLVVSHTPVAGCRNLYYGSVDYEDCLVVVVPNTKIYQYQEVLVAYNTLVDYSKNENFLVRSFTPVEGASHLYLQFETCEPLEEFLMHVTEKERHKLLKKLYCTLVTVMEKHPNLSSVLRLQDNLLPYIFVDKEANPKLLLLSDYQTTKQSFASKFMRNPNFLYEFGCICHLMVHGSPPEGGQYTPPTSYTNELMYVTEHLLLGQWDMETFKNFGIFINNSSERAKFIIHVISNCSLPPRNQKPIATVHSPAKKQFMHDLLNYTTVTELRNLFYTPQNQKVAVDWHSAPEMFEMERINQVYMTKKATTNATYKRSSKPKKVVFAKDAASFMLLFRHFVEHSYDDLQSYDTYIQQHGVEVEEFRNKFGSETPAYTQGEFFKVVHKVFPLFFVTIYSHARSLLRALHFLFVARQ
jgi:hypothetical protein